VARLEIDQALTLVRRVFSGSSDSVSTSTLPFAAIHDWYAGELWYAFIASVYWI